MKLKSVIGGIFFVFGLLAVMGTSCQNRSYPCPAYTRGNSPNPNVAMVVGPDGQPVSTMQVKKDKNGLVAKKKIARIRNR